jgi:hypothetical protein
VISSRNEYEVNARKKRKSHDLHRNSRGSGRETLARALRGPTRRLTRVLVSVVTALALGGLALVVSFNAHASTPPAGPGNPAHPA